jgi:DNA-directed RNA polymerase specialized sigma24 family protein
MTRDLVERAMHGDQEAFGVLAERSLDRLVGTAGLILRDADAAQDAAQDALIRAWRDLPTLRDPDRFGSWLYRVLLNSCNDHRRRQQRHAHQSLAPDGGGLYPMPRSRWPTEMPWQPRWIGSAMSTGR